MLQLRLLLLSLTCAICASGQVRIPTDLPQHTMLLNGTWKFKYINSSNAGADSIFYNKSYNITAWSNIRVPGSWEVQGFAEPNYGGKLKEGLGLYRRNFEIPTSWNGDHIYLAFDGVCFGYDLFVNGKWVGSFASSFNRQHFDITDYVTKGENTLAVKVTTRAKGWAFDTNDDWSLSGISRDVWLFRLPEAHLKDTRVETKLKNNSSIVQVQTQYTIPKGNNLNLQLLAHLKDENGKLVATQKMNLDSAHFAKGSIEFKNAHLWTAETPYLYHLELIYKDGKKTLDSTSMKIGIREVRINGNVLELNNRPVKLKGICHHELSLKGGRYMNRAELLQDLQLVRKANANCIRTSHYPASPYLIELCDSLGIYVIEEVPFGFGDELLLKEEYREVLYLRARKTIERDRNSPSVIVWTVGNENKLTEIGRATGRLVQELDPTRPYCFPTVGSYFKTVKADYPKEVPILAPHYPSAAVVEEYAKTLNRPLIFTEYAHALGLDFDKMETIWEAMYQNPSVAGGAVWHLFDQGIFQKAEKAPDTTKFTPYVWSDSLHYYDHSGDKGADGIVYADRTPQLDYWQVRKVYAPVRAYLNIPTNLKAGDQLLLKTENRYDFKNLNNLKLQCSFYKDGKVVKKTIQSLSANPHDTSVNTLIVPGMFDAGMHIYHLELQYVDAKGNVVYEKSFVLQFDAIEKSIIAENKNIGQQKLKPFINAPLLRVGRKPSFCTQVAITKASEDSINIVQSAYWQPHILKPTILEHRTDSNFNLMFKRGGDSTQKIACNVDYSFSGDVLNMNYQLNPINAKDYFLECGLVYELPGNLTEFRWIGLGPFPAYPGKSALDEWGFHHISRADINFQGNYQQVSYALLTDKKGDGYLVMGDNMNISIERTSNGILLGHNALVSGRFNKKGNPEVLIEASKVKETAGNFRIIPISKAWPEMLQRLFGKPNAAAKIFHPFYYSYDQ